MTHRTDEAPRREVIARWCTLAEQRLDYLLEQALETPDAVFDMTAIEARYPLLRNAL